MLPSVCFSCGRHLAPLQIPYDEYCDKISNDPSKSDQEKEILISEFHIFPYLKPQNNC